MTPTPGAANMERAVPVLVCGGRMGPAAPAVFCGAHGAP